MRSATCQVLGGTKKEREAFEERADISGRHPFHRGTHSLSADILVQIPQILLGRGEEPRSVRLPRQGVTIGQRRTRDSTSD